MSAALRLVRPSTPAARPPGSSPLRIQRFDSPGGTLGTSKALTMMRALALGSEGAQSPQVKALTSQIVQSVPAKDETAEMIAVVQWVQSNIRFTGEHNPAVGESIQSPVVTLNLKTGDCDDFASLVSAFLHTLGIRNQFRVVKPRGRENDPRASYSHVYVMGYDKRKGQWVRLDPTVPDSVGVGNSFGSAQFAFAGDQIANEFAGAQMSDTGGMGNAESFTCPATGMGCSGCSGACQETGMGFSFGGLFSGIGRAVGSSAGQSLLGPIAQGIATRIAYGGNTSLSTASVSSASNPFTTQQVPAGQVPSSALLGSPTIPQWMWFAAAGLAALFIIKR